jgi:TonB-linked SusC/RagA family outer membrane protein
MRKIVAILWVLAMAIGQVSAQSRSISGKVTGTDGSPVPNVSVTIKGTNNGTTTSTDGTYTLSVPSSANSLVFSSVGMIQQEVSIGSKSTINAELKTSDQEMQEVVVVGYGTQKKKELTGSMASVKGTDLANRPVQSFDQALGGRAAGVQITIPSGVLNSAPVFRIRGTNSISLSSYPLIVIDGVPAFTGDFSSGNASANALGGLNPNDIESVDIAKDAAASAIYGSRASNGVVFITTKKGKSGKARVSLDSWVGWTNVQRLPTMLNAFQYTDHKNNALRNAGTYNDNTADAIADNYFALTNGPDGNPINTNWYDVVYRQGFATSNTVNVSGANDATSYYLSVGYTDQQGIIKKNDYKRLSVLANIEHKIGKVLSLGTKLQYSREENLAAVSSGSLGDGFSTAGLGRAAQVTAPNVSPYLNDGNYNYSGTLIGPMNNKQGQVGFNNPVISFDQNRSNSEVNHIIANAFIQLKPVKWATLRSAYGTDYIMVDNDLYSSPISGEAISTNGSVSAIFNKNRRWVWTNTLQLDQTFGEKHTFGLLGGIEQQKSTQSSYGLNRQTVTDPYFTNIQGNWTTPNTSGLGIGENYLYSEFGRFTYDFDKKYFLSANIRRDGASQLGIDGKYGTFYGGSLGWEITQENFFTSMQLDKIFSSLRLRGSYGKVGNIGGLGNFTSLSTFSSGLYGGSGTLQFTQAGNTALSWETSRKTDFGLSFGFFDDRLTGEIDYYYNNINDLLLFVPQPPSAGLPTTIPQNIGEMYNTGLEFTINATPVLKQDFSWNTSFNISYNKNQVTSLALGLDQIVTSTGGLENPSITKPGNPIGMIFVTRTAGVDAASGRRIFINKAGREVYFQNVAPAGQFRFSYADGTVAPSVSAADAVVYKNTNPKFYGGFDNTIRYKDFDLNALFTYQFGSYIYYGTNAGLLDQRFWNNSTDVLTAWQKPGDVTNIPKVLFGDNVSNGSSFPLDMNVFKADFVKLKTITLGYNLPKSIVSKTKINNARFYVAGNNLLIITDYPGPDPEVSSNLNGSSGFGVDRNTVGNSRTVTVGLNLSF